MQKRHAHKQREREMGERVVCEKYGAVVVMVTRNVATGLVNVLIKKVLDHGINHMVIATYRLASSALFLAPLSLFLEWKARPKLTFTILCQHFFSAMIGFGAIHFIWTESLNLKSKAGMAKVVGTLICISGALVLTFYKGFAISNPRHQPEALDSNHDPRKNKTENWLLGCLFNLTVDLLLSLWMLYQTKINVTFPCKYTSTALSSLFGTSQCALLSLIKSRDARTWILRDKFDISVIVFTGVVGQGIATVAMTWSIKKRGPIFTSSFFPVLLVSATLFDFLIFHRQLFISSVMGSVIIVIGLYVFLWGKNRDLKEVSSESTELPTQSEVRLASVTK
ncbi:PREDICTED: WAT1-related protein At1g01070-like isoform X3 [Tarenaya hassleriana]|uniref:WAT1-related protein At1g01070-like isoform X3 n=1 Tax=Tarenaya hassleriana TaxID=28532 RepID=UPI00053C0B3E|nr:PREDICTED: WAT1-related protein At1g01070-like isoform X3 [Tarenaya hassleriana]